MAELNEFLPDIRKQISGPLNLMMTEASLRAAMTFCRESLACRRTVMFSPVVAGVSYPLLSEDENVRCTRIIRIVTPEQQELFVGPDLSVSADDCLRFNENHSTISVLIAVTPLESATSVPDELLRYQEVIADGALELLFMQDKKPWYDPQRAQYFREKFVDGFRRAYRDALNTSPYSPFRNPVRRQGFF